jgi:hypothetical protein
MHRTEQEPRGAQLSVGWQDGVPEQGDQRLERAAAYAAILTHALAAAGYQPRRLDIGLRLRAPGVLEMRVHGDVPRMDETEFGALARTALRTANLAQDIDGSNDVLLLPTLGSSVGAPHPPSTVQPATLRDNLRALPLARVATALVLGGVLGVLGLPRVELPFLAPSAQPPAVVIAPIARDVPAPIQAEPTSAPIQAQPTFAQVVPTATIFRPPTPTPPAPRVLLAERLLSPLPNWPNSPDGTAWFGSDGYRLLARQPGRFVAVGVPLPQPLDTAVLTAQFHKVGGPAGGGYGLVVRDQGTPAERDGRNQAGQFMVLEVGDRGDVGIWERDQTRWIDVMPWTHSDAVHLDRDANLLVVALRGSGLRFEVNGLVLADLTYDGVPPRGGVGIFVGGDQNEVALDFLRIEN